MSGSLLEFFFVDIVIHAFIASLFMWGVFLVIDFILVSFFIHKR